MLTSGKNRQYMYFLLKNGKIAQTVITLTPVIVFLWWLVNSNVSAGGHRALTDLNRLRTWGQYYTNYFWLFLPIFGDKNNKFS
jgi:hypothetical protein